MATLSAAESTAERQLAAFVQGNGLDVDADAFDPAHRHC
jgi:hypothetical protein